MSGAFYPAELRARTNKPAMAGLGPAIHAKIKTGRGGHSSTWMPGTSPGITVLRDSWDPDPIAAQTLTRPRALARVHPLPRCGRGAKSRAEPALRYRGSC